MAAGHIVEQKLPVAPLAIQQVLLPNGIGRVVLVSAPHGQFKGLLEFALHQVLANETFFQAVNRAKTLVVEIVGKPCGTHLFQGRFHGCAQFGRNVAQHQPEAVAGYVVAGEGEGALAQVLYL